MDVAFLVLLWVSSPSGGHSEIFGSLAECEEKHAAVLAASDTLYLSACLPVELKFVKGVRQDYQRPSDIPEWAKGLMR